MKTVPFLAAAMLLASVPTLSAKDCCPQRRCQPCGTTRAAATQWYTAKDGTLREKMAYRDALSRAEDADDMEIELRAAREELTAASEAAATQAADLAALRKQLEEQVAATAAANARADKAEEATQAADTKVAKLSGELQKSQSATAAAAKERDAAQSSLAKANEQVQALTAQVATANGEVERLKQEALESKKVAVATEDYDADPGQDDAPPEDAPPEDAPADDAGGEGEPAAE